MKDPINRVDIMDVILVIAFVAFLVFMFGCIIYFYSRL